MKNILDEIRDELKDVHIETGTQGSFDRVCLRLAERLTKNTLFELGKKAGREEVQDSIKALLNIAECNCDE